MNIKLIQAPGAEVWEGHPGAKGDFAGAKLAAEKLLCAYERRGPGLKPALV